MTRIDSEMKRFRTEEIGSYIWDHVRGGPMAQLSAVVIAGEPDRGSREVSQETAMISALGRPLIDYVLEALRGSREVSEVVVSVTRSTPLTEAHVQSRGYRSICTEGRNLDSDLHRVMQLLSTPYVLLVPSNLPLLRSESIDEIVDAFYCSKKSSIVVGVPVDDVQAVIEEPASIMDMDGVKVKPCGLKIIDRNLAISRSRESEAYLMTDLEDFAVDVNSIGELRLAEGILKARLRYGRSTESRTH